VSCSSGSRSELEYLELIDYRAIAVEVTGLSVKTVARVTNLSLADSALHAPAAGFGETEFYTDFVDKAAVLVARLAKNHPLPDGNKRAAWVALRLFIEINGWRWDPMPTVDDSEQAVLGIAAGDVDEAQTAIWLREHIGQGA
jgi:death-on-curing protein